MAEFSPYGWDQVPGDLNQMTDTRAKTKQTTWCRTTYITFPLTTLIYWSLCLSLKSCALSHAWFLSFQNNMFDSYLMHSWKQLLVEICVVGKAEEVSVSNNQKFTTFSKKCFNVSRLRWQGMSYVSDYILDVLGPDFLTPHCLYWRRHETLIWLRLIKAGYQLTIGANFVILVKSVSWSFIFRCACISWIPCTRTINIWLPQHHKNYIDFITWPVIGILSQCAKNIYVAQKHPSKIANSW